LLIKKRSDLILIRFIFLTFIVLGLSYAGSNEYVSYFDNEKKDRFTSKILPVILEENEKILEERAFIESFFSKEFFIGLNSPQKELNIKRLALIADKYKIDNLYNKSEYLKKVDVIPPSMAMGQAILESGWGSSEYAKELNNFYGHYVFSKKLGIKGREVSGKYERIRVFDNIADSVRSYMLNLNTHTAYNDFRKARLEASKKGTMLSGLKAIEYMEKYSIQKGTYSSLFSASKPI